MFIIAFNDEDKNKLITNGYKLINEDFQNGCKRFIFENKGKLNFANENMKVFKTNKLYFSKN